MTVRLSPGFKATKLPEGVSQNRIGDGSQLSVTTGFGYVIIKP